MLPPETINVYLAKNLLEAEFLHNLLADAGIEAFVIGGATALLAEVIPLAARAPCLWVRQADAEQARAILADYERRQKAAHPDTDPAATWKCAACGELVDEEFDLCWNCQNPRRPY
ncbi:MAG: DUF2007 domain-containing protein [Planctomycetes bacterium]|nr:DUF2007 domain-containing protein [Planctomycetota bacterium]